MAHSGCTEEQELILSIRQKDVAAMKTLYVRYADMLSAVCARYVSDDDIRDILHDSFIKIFTSIDRFVYRGPGSLKAWMTRITVNECLNLLKPHVKFEPLPADGGLVATDQDVETGDIPESVILEMIRNLPDGYRTVFNLYVFERKCHKEIAALLDIKESTSASQLFKAKNMLANQLKRYKNTYHG